MELNVSLYVAILANYISLIFASENLPMTKKYLLQMSCAILY